jgi:hypothetical protein
MGPETELLGMAPHNTCPDRHQYRHEDKGGAGKRGREANQADEKDQRGGDNYTAHRGPIEGETDGKAAAPLEPRCQDDIDRRTTHRSPAQRHDEKRGIELPRLRHNTERGNADGHRSSRGRNNQARTEALV